MRDDVLWTLLVLFVPLSLLSVGGGVSLIAPMHQASVEVHGWLSEQQFIEVFAISRAAPGPGSLIVPLLGWKVAGWPGAIVAGLAILVPSSLLCYGVARLWNRYRGTRLHTAFERGLAPVAAGLILAGTLTILQAADPGGDTGWVAWAVAGLSAAVLFWRSNVNPLIVLFGGGALYTVAVRALA